MAPRGRGTNAQGHHGQPSTLQQQQQVQVPATTATEPENDAIVLDPVTPICHTGPFHPSLHNLKLILAWPSSPDEEDFDFDEVDAIPITPPAAGALGSPVKCAHAVGVVMCSARLGSPRPSKPSHGKPSFSGPCSRLWSAHGSGFSTQEPWAAASATAFCG